MPDFAKALRQLRPAAQPQRGFAQKVGMTDPLPPSAALPLREGENTLPDSDGFNVPLTEGDERERHCRERRGSLTTTSCAKPFGSEKGIHPSDPGFPGMQRAMAVNNTFTSRMGFGT